MTLRQKTLFAISATFLCLLVVVYVILIVLLPGSSVQQEQFYLLGSLIILGGGISGITLLCLEKLVFSQLTRLNEAVTEIGDSGNLSARVTVQAKNELSQLADAINRLLNTLACSQQQQQESEARYQVVVEQTAEGIFLVDADTKHLLDANPAFRHLFGYSVEAIPAVTLYDLVAHDRESIDSNIQHIQTDRDRNFTGERQYRRQDGSLVDVAVSANLISNGNKQAIAVVVRDITERKQAEEELRQAEARYRDIFENAVEGIFQTTPEGHYLNVNPALARIYGYRSPDELMANITDIEHQLYVDPERRYEFIRQFWEEGSVSEFESQVYRKDNSIIWISEYARAVRDSTGRVKYYEGTVEDITKRKQAEMALRQSEAKNRALLNAIPDLMFRISEAGIYLDFKATNPEDLAVLPDQLIGSRVCDVLPPEVAKQAMHHIKQALVTGEMQIFEYQLAHNSGITDYESRLVVSDKAEVLAIVRDITERKKIENLKNEFVSMVSHELRTPLTSVRGSLSLIAGGIVGELPSQAKELIEIALKNSERLIFLINDILDIEKIASGKMVFELQPLSLIALIEQAITANLPYSEQFGVKFELTFTAATKGVQVYVDSDRLMQVLSNLLSNAAKFSPPDGTVTISVSHHDRWIRVSVTDCGPGIPEEFRDRIFQKFAQADSSAARQKGGTGLGLSISKAIIEKLGGHIGFTTDTDVGTTFYFDLSEYQESSSTDPLPSAQSSQTTSQSHLLICEDDRDIATLLSLMLEQGGFATDIAENATQAKELLSRKHYGAITIDLTLPDQDGISLIRELREQEETRDLPIVVVSARADDGREALSGGGFAVIDWLNKPIERDRLMAAVSRALAQKGDRQPQILHVEDDPDVQQVVEAILQELGEVTATPTLETAREYLNQMQFDLVILDLGLPDGSGLELLPYLNHQSGMPPAVVVFSAQEVGLAAVNQVAAALVKSRTSNQELVATIKSLIGCSEIAINSAS